MQFFQLDFFKKQQCHHHNKIFEKFKNSSSFFLWSYYDALLVTEQSPEGGKTPRVTVPAVRHGAFLYTFSDEKCTIFEKNDLLPLLVVFQCSLNPLILQGMAASMDKVSLDGADSAYGLLGRHAKKIRSACGGKIQMEVLGTLGNYEFAVIMRGTSYHEMTRAVNLLRASPNAEGSGIPLLESGYVMLGVSSSFTAGKEQYETVLENWKERWENFQIILDIGMSPRANYKLIEKELEGISGTGADMQIWPQFGKYDALVRVKPDENTPRFFAEFYSSDNQERWELIQIMQTHIMWTSPGEYEPPSFTARSPNFPGVSDDDDELQKYISENLPENLDPTMNQDLFERVSYLSMMHAAFQNSLLVQYRCFMSDVKSALAENLFERENYEEYLRAISDLTYQFEQGSRLSLEAQGSNYYFGGSRSKIPMAYISFFRLLFDVCISDRKKPERADSDVNNIFAVLTASRRLRSFIPFLALKGEKSSVILLPFRFMYTFSQNVPAIFHEFFHYIPPANRNKRNRIFADIVFWTLAVPPLTYRINELREKGYGLARDEIIRKAFAKLSARLAMELKNAVNEGLGEERQSLENTELRLYSKALHNKLEKLYGDCNGDLPFRKSVCGVFGECLEDIARMHEEWLYVSEGRTSGYATRRGRRQEKKEELSGLIGAWDKELFRFFNGFADSSPDNAAEDECKRIYFTKNDLQSAVETVEQFFREARSDWAACILTELDLAGYYRMFFRYAPELEAASPDGAQTEEDDAFAMRFGLVSHLLCRDGGIAETEWIDFCKSTLREVYKTGDCRLRGLEHSLDMYITLCERVKLEDFAFEIFDADWRREFKGYMDSNPVKLARAAYSGIAPDSDVLSSSLRATLHFWLAGFEGFAVPQS